jgi:hypothetical protein
MEQKVSVWKANVTNGIILGLIGIVWTLLLYFLDMTLNRMMGLAGLVIQIVVLYYLIRSYRDNFLGGYITYGQSVGAGVVMFLYYSIIAAIFTYILYKFIDPGLIDKQLAMVEETMVKRGAPQAAIDAGMAFQKKIMVPEITAPLSIFGSMIGGTIMSLIAAIFTRKEGNPLLDLPEDQI